MDDPAADPQEVELLREVGYRSLVIIPVAAPSGESALIEVYSQVARTWSTEEIADFAAAAAATGEAMGRLTRHASCTPH